MEILNYSLLNTHSNEKSIKQKYPWVGERKMLIPDGWFGLVEKFCEELDSSISSKELKKVISYFFVTVRDEKLTVYLDFDANLAGIKTEVISSLRNEISYISRGICHICGAETDGLSIRHHHDKYRLPNCGNHKGTEQNESDDDIKPDDADAENNVQASGDDAQNLEHEHDAELASLKLYDLDQVIEIKDSVQGRYKDSDEIKQATQLLTRLHDAGGDRNLSQISSEGFSFFSSLENEFPNFGEVLNMLKGLHALSSKSEVQRITPILLLGPPGVGKTHFAETLANKMNVSFKVIRMENQQMGAGLCGSGEHWGNSKPGAVFDILTNAKFANPIIVLDELDKVSSDNKYNPLNSLYSLLESNSAAEFYDESLPMLSFDASYITWIITANSIDEIPEPILSRVQVFNIPELNEIDSAKVAQRIYTKLLSKSQSLMERFEAYLRTDVEQLLGTMSPRRMKLSIETGLGKAAIADRRYLTAEDITQSKTTETNRIGFI